LIDTLLFVITIFFHDLRGLMMTSLLYNTVVFFFAGVAGVQPHIVPAYFSLKKSREREHHTCKWGALGLL
jgi:hypothetical protein